MTTNTSKSEAIKGLSIGAKLTMTFLGFIVILGVTLVTVYQQSVPKLVSQQVDLRAISIAKSFSASVLEPMIVRNYLRVNKLAEVTAQLPDVAYAAVFNKRGFPIAGIFGELARFDPDFVAGVKINGFPKTIAVQHRPEEGAVPSHKELLLGGKQVLDIALPLGANGAEVHLGLFIDEVQQMVRASLIPLLILLGAMGVLGLVAILFISRTVSRPIHQLTEQAHAISMGKLDQVVEIKAGGEIGRLAESFGRMQSSLQYSLKHLR